MKFVHIADMHFDSPFVNLSDRDSLGDLRRLDQRKILKKVIDYIKKNPIEFLFISGDLYEHKYIKRSTIEYINNLFSEIPETNIFISPGNHDPYLKNSYYNKFNWSNNVKIFTSKIEKISIGNVDIYGYGFDDFYCSNSHINELKIENTNKLNILVIHGTLDGGTIEDKEYNPLSKNVLREKQLDYIALGHIHKLNYNEVDNQNIVYPGSIMSLGFDEIGEHGMIVGNLEKNTIDLEFIPLDEKEFSLYNLDVTDCNSKEDLIEQINELNFKNNQFIEIILVGKRNFEIDIYELLKLILNDRVIKIKNKTKIAYNLEDIANENTLKGLFAKEMNNRIKNNNMNIEDIEIIEKAIEIGFEALE